MFLLTYCLALLRHCGNSERGGVELGQENDRRRSDYLKTLFLVEDREVLGKQ